MVHCNLNDRAGIPGSSSPKNLRYEDIVLCLMRIYTYRVFRSHPSSDWCWKNDQPISHKRDVLCFLYVYAGILKTASGSFAIIKARLNVCQSVIIRLNLDVLSTIKSQSYQPLALWLATVLSTVVVLECSPSVNVS